ncbi:aspartate/glutamate racemase family protein [Acinetobacter oleivorans]|uniref:aspartate/glutamate racemase family protein n=1 Tax=Acinetobacter oleivorans TaxID=1148157 RepID=UPI001901D55D|nr:amino acid racemase [Acinetobacter oleivorans]MBJ9420934.1 aspartate/glutamate racemase family protein [Acinetobacter oleivorans]
MNKAIGILGGMGPQATIDAMDKIIKNTPAHCDQEHIPVITVSIPDIPDRTQSIINHDDKPLEKMAEYLKILEAAQVGCIIIPCNTAHFWFNQLQQRTQTKMISIIESAVHFIQDSLIAEVCILATSATISTQLYQSQFIQNNIRFSTPSVEMQHKVMQSIYQYKAGNIEKSKQLMSEVIHFYRQNKSIKFLLACTEIPLILQDSIQDNPELFVDATDLLIKNAIAWYQNSLTASAA